MLNKYDKPAVGDLIAYEETDRTISFKVIEALPQSYYSEYSTGIIGFEYYVPHGFVVLRDPLTKATKMVFYTPNSNLSEMSEEMPTFP